MPLFEHFPVGFPVCRPSHGFIKGLNHRAVGEGEGATGVVHEEPALSGGDQPCLLEFRQMSAEVRLVEVQDLLEIADAQRSLVQKVHNAQPVWVRQGFENFDKFHE